jgi:hypothetical protein
MSWNDLHWVNKAVIIISIISIFISLASLMEGH